MIERVELHRQAHYCIAYDMKKSSTAITIMRARLITSSSVYGFQAMHAANS